MIVVNPDNVSNTISVLPRYYDEVASDNFTVEITNEDTRQLIVSTESSITVTDGFLSFDTDANFRNNSTYKLKIYNTISELVYFRDKIFSTNQSEQNYRING